MKRSLRSPRPDAVPSRSARLVRLVALVASAGEGAAPTLAQLSPLGGQFQVNTCTTSGQRYPAGAADSAGNFVVAWDSFGSSGTDTSSFSIQAQRYSANGAALGAQFQINSYTTNAQRYPSVAADSAGDFAVAWTSVGSFGGDSSYSSIQARRFGCVFCDGFESGDTANW